MQPGKVIRNGALVRAFSVGNMGGMRRSKKKRALVIVSDKTKGLRQLMDVLRIWRANWI